MPKLYAAEFRRQAMALGSPGLGPRRLSAQLRRPVWGGQVMSAGGLFEVLQRHGIGTR
jgi:hypothetical protein